MEQLSISDTMLLVEHVAFRMREPVFIWGAPGIGKSEGVAQLAEAHNAVLCDIRVSQYESVDFRGIPDTDKKAKLTVWNAPSTLPFTNNPMFPDDRPIVLFLDEMNSASPAVSAVCYQLINDRRVGEHKLKDNVVVIAAGNREGDKGVTNRQPMPLANRFTHVEAIATADDWCVYAARNNVPPICIAFIKCQPDQLSTFEKHRDKPELGKAFATSRSWSKAFRYFADTRIPEHIKLAAMAGTVGKGPNALFWTFYKLCDKMPTIREIKADPKGTFIPDEASLAYATAISVSGSLDPKDPDLKHLCTYLKRMRPEFQITAWTLACKRNAKLYETDQYAEYAKINKAVW